MAINDRLMRAGSYTPSGSRIRLHLPDGEELGPRSWAKLSGSEELPTLKVTRGGQTGSRRSSSDSGSSDASHAYDSGSKVVQRDSQPGSVSHSMSLEFDDGHESRESGSDRPKHADNVNFILLKGEQKQDTPSGK